jgi:hypothetical protein
MKFIQLNLSTPADHGEATEAGAPAPAVVQPRQPQTFLAALIACAEDQGHKEPRPVLDPFVAALERLEAEALAESEPIAAAMQAAEALAEPELAVATIQDSASESPAEPESPALAMEEATDEGHVVFRPIMFRWQELAVEGPGKAKLVAARWEEVAAEELSTGEEPFVPVEEPIAAVEAPPAIADAPLTIAEAPLTIFEVPLPEEPPPAGDPVAVKPAAMEEAAPAAPASVFVPPPASKPNAFMRAMSWINRRTLSNAKQLRVTETVSLGEKRFVAVVHVEGRKFLIGGGASAVSLLTQLGEESGVPSLAPAHLVENLQ